MTLPAFERVLLFNVISGRTFFEMVGLELFIDFIDIDSFSFYLRIIKIGEQVRCLSVILKGLLSIRMVSRKLGGSKGILQ